MRETSHRIIQLTHNSIHIITPFDSGGSSAELRRAFQMPAVGDLRNRLVALMDTSLKDKRAISGLFAYRLPGGTQSAGLSEEFEAILNGSHRLMHGLSDSVRRIVLQHLRLFNGRMPADFDLRGASLGNLILTGAYLAFDRQLEPAVHFYSRLSGVRGVVRPVLDAALHLTACLENGETVYGQHLLTGKEAPKIQSRVSHIFLSSAGYGDIPVQKVISRDLQAMIKGADLICFPMGSFFSSLLATLLPSGVGRAVARAGCPKVYLPSTGYDPEAFGLNLADQVKLLVSRLLADCPDGTDIGDVLSFIVLDSDRSHYTGGVSNQWLSGLGVRAIDYDLVTAESSPCIDPDRLIEVLISLAG